VRERERGLVVVRGAGDLATGVLVRLLRSGFRAIALETAAPTAIRRTVALSEAVYEGEASVEGIRASRVSSAAEALRLSRRGLVPVLKPGALLNEEELSALKTGFQAMAGRP